MKMFYSLLTKPAKGAEWGFEGVLAPFGSGSAGIFEISNVRPCVSHLALSQSVVKSSFSSLEDVAERIGLHAFQRVLQYSIASLVVRRRVEFPPRT
jgi:hypothetical protein